MDSILTTLEIIEGYLNHPHPNHAMALMHTRQVIKAYLDNDSEKRILESIHNLKTTIMGKLEEVSAALDGLQTSLDTMQAGVKGTIDALDAHITELEALVASTDGATSDQLQGLLDKIASTKADLEGTLANASPSPAPVVAPVETPAPTETPAPADPATPATDSAKTE